MPRPEPGAITGGIHATLNPTGSIPSRHASPPLGAFIRFRMSSFMMQKLSTVPLYHRIAALCG
jgi:hypothetical protein